MIDVRTLAAVGSGTISLYDFYGKSTYVYGQDEFISAGSYTWICPDDVTSISVVCVGGGGGGDAGSDLVRVGGGGGGTWSNQLVGGGGGGFYNAGTEQTILTI